MSMSKIVFTYAPFTNGLNMNGRCMYERKIDEVMDVIKLFQEKGASIVYLPIIFNNYFSKAFILSFYEKLITMVTNQLDILVHLAWGLGSTLDIKEKNMIFDFKPDIISIVPGSINIANTIVINAPDEIEYFAYMAREKKIKICFETFNNTMVYCSQQMLRKGLLIAPVYYNLIIGAVGLSPFVQRDVYINLIRLVDSMPRSSVWSLTSLGRYKNTVDFLGTLLGGHLRIGNEDDCSDREEVLKTFNNILSHIKETDREIASVEETRKILGIS